MELTKQERIKAIVQQYFRDEEGQSIDPEDITASPLFSLSNDVFRVQVRDQKDFLVKVYQVTIPQFTDNELEMELVRQLAAKKTYPEVLYSCQQYRIEKFMGSVPIERGTFGRQKLLQLAKQMAQYSCQFQPFVKQYNQTHAVRPKYSINELQQTFWKIYDKKIKECPDLVQECQTYIGKVFGAKEAMTSLEQSLKESQMVLSHNDCHLGNFLDDGTRLYILDHEFSQFNYIGFDLGNFFNEWATDYGQEFEIREELELPEDVKLAMIRVYFQTLGAKYKFSSTFEDWVKYVVLGRILSHLFWMIVGLRQINDHRIQFSMVKYIKRRQEEFSAWMAR